MTTTARFFDRALHLVMPVFVLGIASAASVARYMRGSLLEVIRQDYIRTARAKGLPERTVVFKHALMNALIPIITLLGLYLPFLMSGSVITETIFAWPGMGRVTVSAIFARDYPVVMAMNLVAGIMVVAGNLLADILYGVVDPRIRYD
jgi:peptide/nickel transport system permease protein